MKEYRTEFHVHTRASHDSLLGRRALLFACKMRRLDCVAITDHNELKNALDWQECFRQHGVDIIPGEEIMTSEGEIIGLFLRERISPGLTPEETIDQIRCQGGIVYLPHPYDEKRWKTVLCADAFERLSGSFDCAEVHNGRNVESAYSNSQKAIVEKAGLMPIVGSDAHSFMELGRNYCITSRCFTRENFLDNLRNSRFNKRPCLDLAHPWTKCVRLIKLLGKGDFDAIRGALHRKLA